MAGVLSQQLRDIGHKLNRKIFRKSNMPWMKTKEYDIICEILVKLQPANCLEWGSGYSTLVLPELLNNLETWDSIEHNEDWFEEIRSQIIDERVKIHFVKPNNPNFGQENGGFSEKIDGLYEDFADYVEFPAESGILYDYIFIDGRARRSCLIKAFDLLSDTGVVIVHDGNRDVYFDNIPEFHDSVRYTDYRKHRKLGGIWIGRKKGKVADILDVDFHTRLWKGHERVAKTLFLR